MAFVLKSILSHMSSATPVFLSCPLAWNISSLPLTFNLNVFFALRWVSCRQQTEGFCFFIQYATLCHLIVSFHPLTFKLIIDRYVFCHFQPCFPVNSMFLLSSFLFLVGWFSFILSLSIFLSVFVNVLFIFDLQLPCFMSMLTPSSICFL